MDEFMRGTALLILVAFAMVFSPFECDAPYAAEKSFVLSWEPVTTNMDGTPCEDLEGYKVYTSTTSGGPYDEVGKVPSGTETFSWSPDPGPDRAYYFIVRSFDDADNLSGASNEVFAEWDLTVPGATHINIKIEINISK